MTGSDTRTQAQIDAAIAAIEVELRDRGWYVAAGSGVDEAGAPAIFLYASDPEPELVRLLDGSDRDGFKVIVRQSGPIQLLTADADQDTMPCPTQG